MNYLALEVTRRRVSHIYDIENSSVYMPKLVGYAIGYCVRRSARLTNSWEFSYAKIR
jgi:6-phosphogluconate dehydrogenase